VRRDVQERFLRVASPARKIGLSALRDVPGSCRGAPLSSRAKAVCATRRLSRFACRTVAARR
jgi:hypothetical protein